MNTNRKWMARFFVALNVIFAGLLAFTDFHTDVYRVVESSGIWGKIAVAGLVAAGTFALLDVLINDVLPAKYALRVALKYRHTVYMLIALGCLSMVFVLVRKPELSTSLIHYALVAYFSTLLAVFDIRDRISGTKR